jgi:hypothetical protein
MSALPPKADIRPADRDVCFGPIADIGIFHSNNSSARPDRGSGTVMPSALAVFRLMYGSTLIPCCTGNSAGFSPLRMHYGQRLHRRANRPNTCLHRPANVKIFLANSEPSTHGTCLVAYLVPTRGTVSTACRWQSEADLEGKTGMCDYSLHAAASRPARTSSSSVDFPTHSRAVLRQSTNPTLRSASVPAPRSPSTQRSRSKCLCC